MARLLTAVFAALLLPVAAASAGAGAEAETGTSEGADLRDRLDWLATQPPPPTSPDDVVAAAAEDPLEWMSDGQSFCFGDDAFLDAGDRTTPDLVLVRSTGACDDIPGMHFHLVHTVGTGSSGAPVVDGYELGFDLDLDASTGCDGWDGFVVAGAGIIPQWISAPSCDVATWVAGEAITTTSSLLTDGAPAGEQLQTRTFSVPRINGTVAWYAGTLTPDGVFDSTIVFGTPDEVIECDGIAPNPSATDGYWLATLHGEIFPLGAAPALGHVCEQVGARSVVDLAITDDGAAWVALQADGSIRTPDGDGAPEMLRDAPWPWQVGATMAVALLRNSDTEWMVVYDNGAVIEARTGSSPFGDGSSLPLNGAIIDAQATESGQGFWLIGTDGGVFSFGDAAFFGSTGSLTLNEPVVGMAPDPDGKGYWLVASDGGVFAFDAPFVGSLPGELAPGTQLNRPITAMVPYGNGYLLLGTDGGVFNFSDRDFAGSLGSNPPDFPVFAVQPIPQT